VAGVRNPDHRQAVADLGAAVVAEPGQVFDHGPFDVILELVGAPNFPANLDALATGGRLMVIGVGAGADVRLDLHRLMTRRARVLASTLRTRPLEQKADAARRVEHQTLPLLADGRLRVPVAATFPLERAQEAYDRFTAGGKLGKLVLVT
jgi:NADPH:quinone reductase